MSFVGLVFQVGGFSPLQVVWGFDELFDKNPRGAESAEFLQGCVLRCSMVSL